MANQLTEEALATIMEGGDITDPIVQVLSIKKMNADSGQPDKDRYRAFLSDGKYTVSFAMMTASVYARAGDKGLPRFSIIKITRYITSVINNTRGQDSRVLLILDLEVLANGDDIGEKIGNPVPHTEAGTSSSKTNGTTSSAPRINGNSNSAGITLNDQPPSKMPKLMNSNSTSVKPSTSNNRSMNPGPYTESIILAGQSTHPISSLSPYHNKWIIKARVTNKTGIRTWKNSRGEGKLFSMDLVDESGEIRLTGFKEMVDKYYDYIQVDKVYYISKCQLKTANKQFTSIKNDYEMSMVPETLIEECTDDTDLANVPQTTFEFVPISQISEREPNTMIDVLGVVKAVGDIQQFTAKTSGRELKKRDIQLLDQSNATVTLTLWGNEAESFDGSDNPVLAIKGARITEFSGGKSLSTGSGTAIRSNPDLKECFRLKGWFESEGREVVASDISAKTGMGGNFSTPWMSFREVTEKQLGSINAEKGDYYQIKAIILLLRSENSVYKACPSPDCNKKVVDQNNGMYRCEKCNKESQDFKYRLLCSMNVGDWSGNQWVSMFSDEAEKVVGITAQEAGTLEAHDSADLAEVMEKAHFKQFTLKCRAKMEIYNDEQRLKTVAVRVEPVNHEDYNSYLIDNINRFLT